MDHKAAISCLLDPRGITVQGVIRMNGPAIMQCYSRTHQAVVHRPQFARAGLRYSRTHQAVVPRWQRP